MKIALAFSAALFALTLQPALAQNNPKDLIEKAIAAQGGAEALRSMKAVIIKGEGKHWEPGQSMRSAANRVSSTMRPSR